MERSETAERHRGMSRAKALFLGLAAAALLASCGDASDEERVAFPGQSGRDAVIEQFGDAMLHGDVRSMADLMQPSAKDQLSAQELAALESVDQPDDVTVTGFGFTVVSEDDSSVEVVYSGERCAPSVSKSFGPTTVTGDANTPDVSSVDEGVVEYGEVECVDVGSSPDPVSPYRFVQVDNRWYWTPPEL